MMRAEAMATSLAKAFASQTRRRGVKPFKVALTETSASRRAFKRRIRGLAGRISKKKKRDAKQGGRKKVNLESKQAKKMRRRKEEKGNLNDGRVALAANGRGDGEVENGGALLFDLIQVNIRVFGDELAQEGGVGLGDGPEETCQQTKDTLRR